MNQGSFRNNVNQLLNSCIELELIKIDRRTAIPQQICFRLDAQKIAAIEYLQANNHQLKLSAANLAAIRYFTLFNLVLEPKVYQSRQLSLCQSCLIFSTQYAQNESNADTLLRSTISPEGKISQQIKQELVQNPLLLKSICDAHYWLTKEIMTQLPFKPSSGDSKLIYTCLSAVFIVCSLILLLPIASIIKLVSLPLLITVGLITIRFKNKWKLWAVYQLAAATSSRGIRREFSLKVLSLFT